MFRVSQKKILSENNRTISSSHHIYIYTHTQTRVTLFYSSFEQTFLSPDRSKQTREGIESALTREGDLHRATSAWIKARGRGNKGGGEGGKTRFPNPR